MFEIHPTLELVGCRMHEPVGARCASVSPVLARKRVNTVRVSEILSVGRTNITTGEVLPFLTTRKKSTRSIGFCRRPKQSEKMKLIAVARDHFSPCRCIYPTQKDGIGKLHQLARIASGTESIKALAVKVTLPP